MTITLGLEMDDATMFCVCVQCSLKDDDSGDHDQEQGSPKDNEKEKLEEDDKEQNITKRKVRIVTAESYPPVFYSHK